MKIRKLKLSAPSRPSRTPKRLRTRRKTQSVSSSEDDGVLESDDSSSSYFLPNLFSSLYFKSEEAQPDV